VGEHNPDLRGLSFDLEGRKTQSGGRTETHIKESAVGDHTGGHRAEHSGWDQSSEFQRRKGQTVQRERERKEMFSHIHFLLQPVTEDEKKKNILRCGKSFSPGQRLGGAGEYGQGSSRRTRHLDKCKQEISSSVCGANDMRSSSL
jgi:hypothetical protein